MWQRIQSWVWVGVLIVPILLVAGLVSGAPSTDPIYVDHQADGNNDGSSWADAYTDLQDALGIAQEGDEIWVAQGIYYPAPDGSDRTATFELVEGVAVYGGFAGTEGERDQRNWEENVTVLSGDLDRNDITDPHGVVTDTANIIGDNAYHVVTGSDVDDTAVLDGFTITAGNADGGVDAHRRGGGMYNDSCSPTVSNVTFSGNRADWDGGGMLNHLSSPTLTNVTFNGNTAVLAGGGMRNQANSSPTLTDVSFSGNTAAVLGGGGMDNWHSSPTLINVTVSDNEAGSQGGGMYNHESNTTLTNVTFSGNRADWDGGGMLNHLSSPTLTNVTFNGNTAVFGGGGMRNQANSSPTLSNVTFSGNSAEGSGGGMDNHFSSPTLTSVTFSGNTTANRGGGMYNDSSSPTLTDITFSGNSATSGGGMDNWEQSSPTLTDVTFSGNTAEWGGGMNNTDESSPTLTNVTFSGNTAGHGGGGMLNWEHSSPTLTNVTFSGNTAAGHGGGGMVNGDSSPTLTNVTFSGNTAADWGGGMENVSSSPMLTNVTFSGNTAAGHGGGGMTNFLGSDPTLVNCILWGNAAAMGNEIYNDASTPSIRHSTVEGSGCSGDDWDDDLGMDGGGNIDADPEFVSPVPASEAPTTGGNYRLRQGSPAIDAGTNEAVTVDTDLDGNPRIVDGTGDGEAVVDMGAYEFQRGFSGYLPLVTRNR